MEIDQLEISSSQTIYAWKFEASKVMSMKWIEYSRLLLSLVWKKVTLIIDMATTLLVTRGEFLS
jgi:hypothetical protein